jgi:uncharacterized protein (TIGR02466 family)
MITLFERVEDYPLFKFKLDSEIFDKICQDVYASIDKNQDVGHTLVGSIYNGSEVLLNSNNNVLTEIGKEFVKQTSSDLNVNIELFVSEAWTVLQKENDYNPLHMHSSFLSGVMYIEVPEFIGKIKDTRRRTAKRNEDGYITFVNSFRFKTFKPVVGEGFIFASNLPHMVYPFSDSGRRISISWNLELGNTTQINYN